MTHTFFFFKQKTAYEMRISDWSSDVCSSDLVDGLLRYTCGEHAFVEGQLDAGQPVSQADSRLLSGRIDRSGRFDFRAELLSRRARARSHQGWGILGARIRSEEHTYELQSLMRLSYDVFCLKKKNRQTNNYNK